VPSYFIFAAMAALIISPALCNASSTVQLVLRLLNPYDIVAVRFMNVATTRAEWGVAIKNLVTLLKPGGWLQWIESCNFALYNSVPGTSRKAYQEVWDALEPIRDMEDVVIRMMMWEKGGERREEVWTEKGLVEVYEDVFFE
jgi:hypothetical protein